jgi:DNA-directed RNA polymerase
MIDNLIDVEENTADSLSIFVDLSEGALETDPIEKAQIELEQEMHQSAVEKFLGDQDQQEQQGIAAETKIYRNLIAEEHENVVGQMQLQHKVLNAEVLAGHQAESSPELLRVVDEMVKKVGYDAMALIGLSEVVNHLSFSPKRQPYEVALLDAIGEAVDFQAFVDHINGIDPDLVRIISRFYLEDRTKRQRKKIDMSIEYAMGFEHIEWDFLTTNEKSRIAFWIKECVFYGTGLFESFPTFRKKDNKTRYVILLTEMGEKVVDKIAKVACSAQGNSYPMIAPPKPWGLHTPGGYYLTHPGQRSLMIHNSANTIPSQLSIDSLNNLQSVKWTINQWLLDVQIDLSNDTTEIGSFRTYDIETYRAKHPLLINPEVEELTWDDAQEDAELLEKKRKAYAILKQAQQEESTAANNAIATARAMDMAARFRELEFFYLPWYFDNRLRQYCLVDTLNPQGSDSCKSLIRFYEGVPKSDESYRDILISLATTYGNGLDKMSYEGRIENAKKMIPTFALICKDPLSKTAKSFWSKADEPFQYLALVKEYHDVFITNTQDMHYVSTGRDATCSGIQLAGALLRDAKTCHLVNVTPSENVQDAYKAVAEEAVKLMSDPVWLKRRIDIREANRKEKAEKDKKKALKRLKQGLPILREPLPYEPRFECEVDIDLVDRGVAKMIVMLTPYGGQFPTMLDHVTKKMQKNGSFCPREDYSILTHALIEGMSNALPGFSALNVWFKSLAKARLDSGYTSLTWITPTQSVIQQEYFDKDEKEVRSYVHGTKKIRYNSLKSVSDKIVKEGKMQTALAANTIHSLDASLLQLALHDYNETPFTTVHDCVYAPSGALENLSIRIRHAFVDVVRDHFLKSMLDTNALNEDEYLTHMLDEMMHEDDGLLDSIVDSKYLFS